MGYDMFDVVEIEVVGVDLDRLGDVFVGEVGDREFDVLVGDLIHFAD